MMVNKHQWLPRTGIPYAPMPKGRATPKPVSVVWTPGNVYQPQYFVCENPLEDKDEVQIHPMEPGDMLDDTYMPVIIMLSDKRGKEWYVYKLAQKKRIGPHTVPYQYVRHHEVPRFTELRESDVTFGAAKKATEEADKKETVKQQVPMSDSTLQAPMLGGPQILQSESMQQPPPPPGVPTKMATPAQAPQPTFPSITATGFDLGQAMRTTTTMQPASKFDSGNSQTTPPAFSFEKEFDKTRSPPTPGSGGGKERAVPKQSAVKGGTPEQLTTTQVNPPSELGKRKKTPDFDFTGDDDKDDVVVEPDRKKTKWQEYLIKLENNIKSAEDRTAAWKLKYGK